MVTVDVTMLQGNVVVSNASVTHSCWSICSWCSESNNTNLLLHLLIAVLGTGFCSTYQT